MVRNTRLDALRGVAILAVFFFHMVLEFNVGAADGWLASFVSGPLNFFVPGSLGVLGVQLFFVISGYCIHQTAIAHDRTRGFALEFWKRRFWRIYPAYLFVCLLLIACLRPSDWLGELWIHGLLLQDLVEGHINHLNPSWWSLAVEAHLYLLYPLLHLTARRLGWGRSLAVGVLLCVAWQLTASARHPSTVDPLIRYGFAWLLGVALYRLIHARQFPSITPARLVAATVATALILLPIRNRSVYVLLPPCCAVLAVAWAVQRNAAESLMTRGLAAVGRVSYALYLIHQPLLTLAGNALGPGLQSAVPFFFTGLAVLVPSIGLAAALEAAAARVRR